MTVYVATNIETGEEIEGGARYIAKRLGVALAVIYQASSAGHKVKFMWEIDKIDNDSDTPNTIPKYLLEEWDEVTEKWKNMYKRGKCNVVDGNNI